MVEKICEEVISYGGESKTLRDMRGEFCPMCGEGVWDEASYRRYTEAQEELLRSVSTTIRRIRKSLKLRQTELVAVFGLGKVAFSRYESGETRPSVPVVKLLKLWKGIRISLRKCETLGKTSPPLVTQIHFQVSNMSGPSSVRKFLAASSRFERESESREFGHGFSGEGVH
jgi:HTH-type transcriptional regulator / antitoxin MqsA